MNNNRKDELIRLFNQRFFDDAEPAQAKIGQVNLCFTRKRASGFDEPIQLTELFLAQQTKLEKLFPGARDFFASKIVSFSLGFGSEVFIIEGVNLFPDFTIREVFLLAKSKLDGQLATEAAAPALGNTVDQKQVDAITVAWRKTSYRITKILNLVEGGNLQQALEIHNIKTGKFIGLNTPVGKGAIKQARLVNPDFFESL